eukprot:CAMPEP_0171176310 /NCGR_PEP_ID=MMETSP0790-20130122/11670_1 /TAXON_ID=2925 /ORGANISM="Alexandrium catenella, Strain OF101" /LENGTH=175 /DNA_ID=CAMNT_0011641197 /DNA_START=211 /DNA_END=739 /DNA_ORIENTATION=+
MAAPPPMHRLKKWPRRGCSWAASRLPLATDRSGGPPPQAPQAQPGGTAAAPRRHAAGLQPLHGQAGASFPVEDVEAQGTGEDTQLCPHTGLRVVRDQETFREGVLIPSLVLLVAVRISGKLLEDICQARGLAVLRPNCTPTNITQCWAVYGRARAPAAAMRGAAKRWAGTTVGAG